jgi:hypothetical protein
MMISGITRFRVKSMLDYQTKFPLATLVIEASKRDIKQKARLLALAWQIAQNRGVSLDG